MIKVCKHRNAKCAASITHVEDIHIRSCLQIANELPVVDGCRDAFVGSDIKRMIEITRQRKFILNMFDPVEIRITNLCLSKS